MTWQRFAYPDMDYNEYRKCGMPTSNPYFKLARHYACEYGLVLAYSDFLEGRQSYPLMALASQLPQAIKNEIKKVLDIELKRRRSVK